MGRDHMIAPELHMPNDVLADDDCVVDQDTDRQRQAEERHRVQREAEDRQRHERRQHRHRQRQTRDHRRAPGVEEQEHDEDGEQRTLDQRLLDVTHGMAHPVARVADDFESGSGRQCLL